MRILITNTFKRAAKKLHRNQVVMLEDAIKKVKSKPDIGELKVGSLVGVRVYRFHMLHQLILLAYIYNDLQEEITSLAFSSHKNFYEKLKGVVKD